MTTLAARIRGDVERAIVTGGWPPGHRIPFEHELAAQYGCSRMTVNKVLSELASSGLIVRRRKAGSFVAMPQAERALMAIEDFAEEAARLGVPYRYERQHRAVERLDAAEARTLGVPPGQDILRVAGRHHVGASVIACEDRVISLAAVPQARAEPFDASAPGSWLLHSVPWTQAEHLIRACNADDGLAATLGIQPGAACLVLERRTWLLGAIVTVVQTTYPGQRYRFAGRFSPTR